MIKIFNTSDKTQHGYKPGRITGEFRQIVILSEKDLEDVAQIMCGISCELIIVPRSISKKERDILNLSITDGCKFFGKIMELK